jgi:predicted SAM-dependent methyltransferase
MVEYLEIGCGLSPREPLDLWHHCDVTAHPHVEFNCSAKDLKLPDGSLKEVYMTGVFEHFTYKDADLILKNVTRMLRSGGILTIEEIPDQLSYIRNYFTGKKNPAQQDMGYDRPQEPKHRTVMNNDFTYLDRAINGWQRWPGDEHLSMWNPEMLNFYLDKNTYDVTIETKFIDNALGQVEHYNVRAVKK